MVYTKSVHKTLVIYPIQQVNNQTAVTYIVAQDNEKLNDNNQRTSWLISTIAMSSLVNSLNASSTCSTVIS